MATEQFKQFAEKTANILADYMKTEINTEKSFESLIYKNGCTFKYNNGYTLSITQDFSNDKFNFKACGSTKIKPNNLLLGKNKMLLANGRTKQNFTKNFKKAMKYIYFQSNVSE